MFILVRYINSCSLSFFIWGLSLSIFANNPARPSTELKSIPIKKEDDSEEPKEKTTGEKLAKKDESKKEIKVEKLSKKVTTKEKKPVESKSKEKTANSEKQIEKPEESKEKPTEKKSEDENNSDDVKEGGK